MRSGRSTGHGDGLRERESRNEGDEEAKGMSCARLGRPVCTRRESEESSARKTHSDVTRILKSRLRYITVSGSLRDVQFTRKASKI
jgi:hypothetical protein